MKQVLLAYRAPISDKCRCSKCLGMWPEDYGIGRRREILSTEKQFPIGLESDDVKTTRK